MCPVRSVTYVTGCTVFHHHHHRPTRPDVTGPKARFPIFLPTTPITLSGSRQFERPSVSRARAASGAVLARLPRTAAPKTRAPSPRHGAPRRPSRPRAEGQPTGRPPLRRPQAQAKSRSSLWSLDLILCQRLRTVTACRPVAAATWSHGMFSFRIRTISRSTGSSVSSAAASLVRNS